MTKNWSQFPPAEPTGEDLANFSVYRLYEKSAIAGYGVLGGCVVTRISADEVAVASGVFTVGGVSKPFAGGNITSIAVATAGYHRYDLIYIDGADLTLKTELGVEEEPDSALDFLENYHPRPAEPTDTDWIILAVVRVTDAGITDSEFGSVVYAQDSIADMRLGPALAVDDVTLQVIDGVASVKAASAHASTHKTGGGDSIKLDEFATPENNTNLNVSATAHGLCPIFPNNATTWLRGDGTYTAVTASSLLLGANCDVGSYKLTALQFESDIATGVGAPFVVVSTAKVTNLNSDTLDGLHDTAFIKAAGTVALTGNWDAGSYQIRAETLKSDIAAGDPPIIVASDTVVPNLNVSKLEGNAASAFAVAAKGVTGGDAHAPATMALSTTSRIVGRKAAGAGAAEECTLSEVLDFVGSAAWGDILYRGTSGWSRLGHGEAGQVLKSGGHDADLAWTDAAEIDIIGVSWDTASNSPALTRIDVDGNTVVRNSAWFDRHPVWGGMKRCTLAVDGTPTFGTNARGDGLTLDGTTGQVMVRIPRCYIKAEKSGTVIKWWISPFPYPGFALHPAFKQRSGQERAQIYLGAYAACLGITPITGVKYLLSKTGEQPFTGEIIIELPFDTGSSAPVVGETLTGASSGKTGIVIGHNVASGAFGTSNAVGKVYLKQPGVATSLFTNPENMQRTGPTTIMATTGTGAALSFTRQLAETYGNAIGSTRWGCENIWSLDLVTLLYLIEYANWNSQSSSVGIGQGVVNKAAGAGFAGENNGALSADSNIAANGTGTGTGTDGLTPIVYRGIENLWGNVWQFIIGLDAVDAAYRILKRDGTGVAACPLTGGNYESSVAAPYTYGADGYASNILFEELTKFLVLANAVAGSSSTYLCDYFWAHRSGQTNILLAGGGWNAGADAGVGCRNAADVSAASYRNVGARVEFS
jgi:hypothetical protein